MECGLCHGLGRLSEFGETWPCPLCSVEIEEEKELTEGEELNKAAESN